MKIYFMRHGQTNFNTLQLCNDNPSTDVHLTALGIQQAEEAALKLETVPFEKIIVSELPRTRQTAEIVNRNHLAPIVTDSYINDIRSGFDGRSVTEYQEAMATDPLHTKVNGGESLLEHKHRVLQFLQGLKKLPNDFVLVVAHEETLRVVLAFFRELSDLDMLKIKIDNCEFFSFNL